VAEDEVKTVLDFGQIGRGEELVKRKVFHELIVFVHCAGKVEESAFSSSRPQRAKLGRTDIGGLLETRIGDERHRRVEPFGVLEDVEGKNDRIAPQLLLDALQRLLHAEPEVDLLTCGAACDVAVELGDVLNLLDPTVDFALELVEECRVGEKGWVDGLDRRANARSGGGGDGG
jgi:hypothetical protein